MPQKILIADDHLLVRGGLKIICQTYFPKYEIYFAKNFTEIEQKFEVEKKFQLLILDINFENDNSLLFIDKIIALQPNIKILVYTGLNKNLLPNKLKTMGIKGFVSKLADEDTIVEAITTILSNKEYFKVTNTHNTSNEINPEKLFNTLSVREAEVMNMYVQGFGNLEISNKLDIQPSTISTYRKRILEKLNVKDLPALIELYNLCFGTNEELRL